MMTGKTIVNAFISCLLFLLISIQAGLARANAEAPEFVVGARTIDSATAKLLFDKGYFFLDVRGLEDFKAEHIPGTFHLRVKSDFIEDCHCKKGTAYCHIL